MNYISNSVVRVLIVLCLIYCQHTSSQAREILTDGETQGGVGSIFNSTNRSISLVLISNDSKNVTYRRTIPPQGVLTLKNHASYTVRIQGQLMKYRVDASNDIGYLSNGWSIRWYHITDEQRRTVIKDGLPKSWIGPIAKEANEMIATLGLKKGFTSIASQNIFYDHEVVSQDETPMPTQNQINDTLLIEACKNAIVNKLSSHLPEYFNLDDFPFQMSDVSVIRGDKTEKLFYMFAMPDDDLWLASPEICDFVVQVSEAVFPEDCNQYQRLRGYNIHEIMSCNVSTTIQSLMETRNTKFGMDTSDAPHEPCVATPMIVIEGESLDTNLSFSSVRNVVEGTLAPEGIILSAIKSQSTWTQQGKYYFESKPTSIKSGVIYERFQNFDPKVSVYWVISVVGPTFYEPTSNFTVKADVNLRLKVRGKDMIASEKSLLWDCSSGQFGVTSQDQSSDILEWLTIVSNNIASELNRIK